MRYRLFFSLSLIAISSTGQAIADTLQKGGNEYLDMNLHQLMEITITSVSKKPQPLKDAAAAVFVITQEDIKRSGVTSIANALAMAPGINVARISSSRWSISSRGFPGIRSNKLLVMIDGRIVYSPSHSGTFWELQNTLLEDIDRIEVIRGPGGTLWGANAVNGVINIITSKVDETQGNIARVGIGTEEKFQAAARATAQLGEYTYGRIYGSFYDRDSNRISYLSPIGGGLDANDDWQNGQIGFKVNSSDNNSEEWTVQGDLYKNSGNQIVAPYWIESPPYLTYKYGKTKAEGGNLLGRWQRTFSGNNRLTVQSYFDYSKRDDDYYRDNIQTIDLDVQYEHSLSKRNNMIMGIGIRRVESDFDPSFQVTLQDQTDMLYSTFLQDEIVIFEDLLWLTLGTKYEQNDYTGNEWQPSGSLLWKPTPEQSVWTSVARAVRTPSIFEHTASIVAAVYPTPAGTVVKSLTGNKDFESEIVLAYEAGYRWQIDPKLGIDLSLFYNEYDGLYMLTPSGYDFSFTNSADGNSFGFECVVDWNPTSKLNVTATYAFIEQEFFIDEIVGVDTSSNTDMLATSSPRHQASLRTSYQLFDQIQLNLWLRYTDSIRTRSSVALYPNITTLDDYFQLDANIIWTPIDNLEVMLAGQNLLNESQLQYLSENLTPPTEIERGVYLKMTYTF